MGTWKKYLSVCLALLCSALQASPEKEGVIRLRDGNHEGCRIVKQTGEVVEIDFLLSSLLTEEFVFEKEIFTRIGLTGFFLPNEAGAPDLPATGRFIAISSGCLPVVEILTFEADTLHGMHIPPAMEIPHEKGPLPMTGKKNPDIYNSSDPYPSAPVTLSEPYSIRGVDAVMLGISPFAYFPLSQTLVVYHRISLRITFIGGKGIGANEKYRSRSWDPLLHNIFLNAASLPEADYGWMYDKGVEGCEYLIDRKSTRLNSSHT